MYKSKKHWVIASVATVAILGTHQATILADSSDTTMINPTTTESSASTPSSEQTSTISSSQSDETAVTTDHSSEVTTSSEEMASVTSDSRETSTSSAESQSQTLTDSETANDDKVNLGANTVTSETASSSAINSQTQSFVKARVLATSPQAQATEPVQAPVTATIEGDKTLHITYQKEMTAGTDVIFAVWGDQNAQNDLVWYKASDLGAAYVDLTKHREYGLYHVNTYTRTNGQMTGVSALTLSFPKPQVSAEVTKLSDTQFQIDVTQVPSTITAVRIPVWTSQNNQDDLKWYQAIQVASGHYQVTVNTADHHNEMGHYNIHIYGQSTITGSQVGLTVTGYDNVDTRPNAQVSIVDYAQDKTSFTVQVTGTSSTKTITKVSIAAWSETDGQDDLKWYTPVLKNNQASQVINIADLSNTTDLYRVHVYTQYSDGSQVGTNLGAYQITKPSLKTEVDTQMTDSGINVKVTSNMVTNYQKVKFAVWSVVNGQDDLKWYQADATGKAFIPFTNHKGYGDYRIDTYSFENGSHGLKSSTVTRNVPQDATINLKNKVTTQNYQKSDGTIDVVVLQGENDKTINKVRVAAWSEEKQSNLYWYTSSVNQSGKVVITVNQANHYGIQGNYTIHTYLDYSDGTSSGTNLGQFLLNGPTATSASQGNYKAINKVIYLDAGHGGYDSGASYYNQYEKTLNLQIQKLVQSKLQALGYTVLATRQSDVFIDLLDRSKEVNATNADIFVSIHINASTSSAANGIETYYYQYYSDYPSQINDVFDENPERLAKSAILANAVQSALIANTGAQNNGVKREAFSVLRETTAPAILAELGFISNYSEMTKLTQSAYQEQLANGIVSGIQKYYASI
ncbi:KxYKxGKxW signal peptide [Streptococcus urinalis FB127-CNA-2]|nr:KxYKxGKxW signal peptide [Streptococcus urinalis FB127-CNA-2]VEF32284.1 serotype determinant, cell wall hydrolase/autolysin [Streptococcus urinalis]